MRERLLSLLLRTKRPPLVVGIICGALCIAAEALLSLFLERVTSGDFLGGIYLLGVLLVSAVWGPGLGLVTLAGSTVAFTYFNLPPAWSFSYGTRWMLTPLPIFLLVGLVIGSIAALARSLNIQADDRRREADLAAQLVHILLRAKDLEAALPPASRLLARALGAQNLEIRLGEPPEEGGGEGVPLTENGARVGTLILPADVPEPVRRRLRERMVPSLEALLRAARDRENIEIVLASSRDEIRRIAQEQAALRRVATLVARGISSAELFNAVAFEMGFLMEADHVAISRYDPGHVTVLGSWSRRDAGAEKVLPLGSEWPLNEVSVSSAVLKTGRPTRRVDYAHSVGKIATWAKRMGVTSAVGSPVIVDGCLWGVMIVFSSAREPRFEGGEERMMDFTELVATAISNAQARAELAASRARVVAAADETRRRIERDLHDGAQQRLVSLGLELRAVEAGVPPPMTELRGRLSHAVQGLTGVVDDLRELSRGIHPAILSKGGLVPALKALARRSALPVELELAPVPRLPERVEVAVYYTAAEALTNVVKHANASVVYVTLGMAGAALRLSIRDDGGGGADYGKGSGLIGLRDRVETLGGRLMVMSSVGEGTSLSVTIPIVMPPIVVVPARDHVGP
ncbi:sensor histidine kinase [Streptosporangium sp. V21-05]|uniref:sensor histidine kinase n=1 Tax=Streptosporangium sp. V21-05 TaxID=3446115 RepID=UPI003F53842A